MEMLAVQNSQQSPPHERPRAADTGTVQSSRGQELGRKWVGRERLGWCEGGVVVGTTEDRGGGVIRGEAIKLQWLIIHGGRDKKDDTEGTLRDEQKQTIRCRCRVELPTAWVSLETVKGYNSSTNVCQLTTDARGEMGQQTELNNRHKKKKEKKNGTTARRDRTLENKATKTHSSK